MTIDSQGRKISNFPALTSIPDGAVLTFVSGSTNYKITKANFLTALGVTGTLVAAGAGSATPVLQTAGSVYTIRGLEDGNGIVCSVSPDNGITVANNFTQEGSFTALVSSFSVASPVFASLKGGTGISVAKSSNIITISATGDQPFGIVTMHGNSTATTIAGTAAPVIVAGTWTAGDTENFSASTGGRLTYTGAETARFSIKASITMLRATGSGNVDVSAYLYKNGSVISASQVTATTNQTNKHAVCLPYSLELAQNDYIELYVANDTNPDDLTVTNAIFIASR
jgi:hypothetical protein